MTARADRARRIWELDPEWGHAPWRSPPSRAERVLHLHLSTPQEPQAALCAALSALAAEGGYERIDWTALASPQERHAAAVAAATRLRPTLVFMQLQRPGVLARQTVAELRQRCAATDALLVSWCGDVGGVNGPDPAPGDGWAFELAQDCDLMLYASLSQVRAYRSRGMACAAYLQIGYDEDRYFEGEEAHYGALYDAVFFGTHYGEGPWRGLDWQEADLRARAVACLRQRLGARFGIFGAGWGAGVEPLPPARSGELYRGAHAALSVSLTSRLERYTSDRLWRALACGVPVLVKDFSDRPAFGLRDGENCLLWNHPHEAAEAAANAADPARRAAMRRLGRQGAALAREHHAWGTRLLELGPLLAAMRGKIPVLTRPW